MAANLGRMIGDYRGLVETCRQRADELALSRLELDRLAGLPAGYSGKLLGKGGSEPRRMWPIGLEAMLGTLGLKILLIEDEAATARTLALREPVNRTQQRFGTVCRLSAKLLEKPSQPRVAATAQGRFRKTTSQGQQVRLTLTRPIASSALQMHGYVDQANHDQRQRHQRPHRSAIGAVGLPRHAKISGHRTFPLQLQSASEPIK